MKTIKRYVDIEQKHCVAGGACMKVCPLGAMTTYKGMYAVVDTQKCVGCGKCEKECPASTITLKEVSQ